MKRTLKTALLALLCVGVTAQQPVMGMSFKNFFTQVANPFEWDWTLVTLLGITAFVGYRFCVMYKKMEQQKTEVQQPPADSSEDILKIDNIPLEFINNNMKNCFKSFTNGCTKAEHIYSALETLIRTEIAKHKQHLSAPKKNPSLSADSEYFKKVINNITGTKMSPLNAPEIQVSMALKHNGCYLWTLSNNLPQTSGLKIAINLLYQEK